MDFGSNLKIIRKKHALSLRSLSQLCDVSKTMLSEIESGKKTPTITVAYKIASALGISLATLMQKQESVESAIIRKNERLSYVDPDTSIMKQIVSPSFDSADVEITFVTIPAGASTGLITAANSGCKEYLVLIRGAIKVKIGQDNICELHEEDALYFEAHKEHEIINTGIIAAEYFLIYRRLSKVCLALSANSVSTVISC